MSNKQIIIDGVDVSNFCLVCYYDNKTNELVRIEQYNDNDSSMYSDIESYKYGYNAKIVKPEEIIKKLQAKEQECEELKSLLKVRIEDLCDSCGASSMKLMPCKVYEKTLTEIKEIAESEMDSKEFMAVQCMLNGSVDNKNKVLKQILQKIRECGIE